jgi:hypothetical protein
MKPFQILAAIVLAAAATFAHAVGRMVDLAVQDRATGRELPVYWHDGKPYVVGRPGGEYRIVLRNRRGEDFLAVVSVDGVNVLSGETASPDQDGYVLSAWQRMDVAGWRKSLDEVAAFYFTSLGDSYAGRTGRPANVGAIGVALFRRAAPPPRVFQDVAPERKREEWPGSANSAPPAESRVLPRAAQAPAAQGAPLGTGHGPREDSRVRYVEFERASLRPIETITLYYDSYPNLVAQGVIAQPRHARDPDPFPARFVPDPC